MENQTTIKIIITKGHKVGLKRLATLQIMLCHKGPFKMVLLIQEIIMKIQSKETLL